MKNIKKAHMNTQNTLKSGEVVIEDVMKQGELNEVLRVHQLWLEEKVGGIKANLKGANLEGANLEEANLRWANLEGANLRWANLEGANLGRANLEGANLGRANLEGANLGRANLIGANLGWANLKGANLEGANLIGANLRWANLRWANLERANLKGANLEGANWDYSCFPIWCGGSCFKADMRLVNQLLAHICTFEVDSEEFTELKKLIMPYAVKSHRAKDLELEV